MSGGWIQTRLCARVKGLWLSSGSPRWRRETSPALGSLDLMRTHRSNPGVTPSRMDAQPCPGKVPDQRDKQRPRSQHFGIWESLGTRLLEERTREKQGGPGGVGVMAHLLSCGPLVLASAQA